MEDRIRVMADDITSPLGAGSQENGFGDFLSLSVPQCLTGRL